MGRSHAFSFWNIIWNPFLVKETLKTRLELTSIPRDFKVKHIKGFKSDTRLVLSINNEICLYYPAEDVSDHWLLHNLFLILLQTFFFQADLSPTRFLPFYLLDVEAFQFFVAHVKQKTEEVLSVLLFISRVVALQKLSKDVFSVYHFVAEGFVQLKLGVKVFLDVTKFWDCAILVQL